MSPFKSEAQRKFMWSRHPDIAKRWAEEYPNQKDLPKHKNYAENIKKALRRR